MQENLTIWKVELSSDSKQKINLPEGAKFLDVQMQRNSPCVWALVDYEKKQAVLSN